MKASAALQPKRDILDALRQKVGQIECSGRKPTEQTVTTGLDTLDRMLPAGGLVPGTLTEWLWGQFGSGAWTLSLLAARAASETGGVLVVIDHLPHGAANDEHAGEGDWQFYPPAAMAWGIDPQRLIIVRVGNEKDRIWAFDQALRCEGVAAVWSTLARLPGNDFRRLQLAAEAGGSLGLMVRPDWVRKLPAWSEVQWTVSAQPATTNRRLLVELVRCRGKKGCRGKGRAAAVLLEIDEATGILREVEQDSETHRMPLVTELAPATSGRRSAAAPQTNAHPPSASAASG